MKNSNPFLLALSSGALLFLLSGCFYDSTEEPAPIEEEVFFSLDIQPIFDNDCTLCHPTLEPQLDLTSGNAYNSLINGGYINTDDPGASLLYQRLIGNPSVMPPTGSLPASQIGLVRAWIEQGAPNN